VDAVDRGQGLSQDVLEVEEGTRVAGPVEPRRQDGLFAFRESEAGFEVEGLQLGRCGPAGSRQGAREL
jgi:hypothetical protein